MSLAAFNGPGPDDELVLDAETVEEFLALLRHILIRAGRTAGAVAQYTGIPRSTAYWFVNPTNTALPKEREQVKLFVQACKLNSIQVNRVLWLWDNLRAEQEQSHVQLTRTFDGVLVDKDRESAARREPQTAIVVHGDYHVHNTLASRYAPAEDDEDDDQYRRRTRHRFSMGDHEDDHDGGTGGGPGGGQRGPRAGGGPSLSLYALILEVVGDRFKIWNLLILFLGFAAVFAVISLCLALVASTGSLTALGVFVLSVGVAVTSVGQMLRRNHKRRRRS